MVYSPAANQRVQTLHDGGNPYLKSRGPYRTSSDGMQKGRPDRGRGRGGGQGQRAKGVTLREHRARKQHHRPAQLFPDLDEDQDDIRQRFARRQLKPGPTRSLSIEEEGGAGTAVDRIALREQTRRLLTETPEEWDGLIQQAFDHIAADQALLAESLQSLFALDLNELADSLGSLPNHVYLKLPGDYDDTENNVDVAALDDDSSQSRVVIETEATASASATEVVPTSEPSQAAAVPLVSAPLPATHDSDQELDDLLELANRDVADRSLQSQAIAGDSDSEIDRLLDDL